MYPRSIVTVLDDSCPFADGWRRRRDQPSNDMSIKINTADEKPVGQKPIGSVPYIRYRIVHDYVDTFTSASL